METQRVVATPFDMLRRRFWPLVGQWAVFLAIQSGGSMVMGVAMLLFGVAGAGLDDPAALGGMVIGMIVFLVPFYGAYLMLIFAQQAALVTMAWPLEDQSFGAAMTRGFRSAVPFFAISLVLTFGYMALATLFVLLASVLGEAAALVGGVLALLSLPLMVWLGCRFAVLVPVVAVEQVIHPIAALKRCWAVTQGDGGVSCPRCARYAEHPGGRPALWADLLDHHHWAIRSWICHWRRCVGDALAYPAGDHHYDLR
jgi:hypothetical protein